MRSKPTHAWLLALLVLAVAVPARPAAAKGDYLFTFDDSLKPWAGATDSLFPGFSLELRNEQGGPNDRAYNSYANIKFIASSSASVAWMLASFPAAGVEAVELSFNVKDTGNCGACRPVVYVGTGKPYKGDQFSEIVTAKDPPLDDNWHNYHYGTFVKAGDDYSVLVAIGWRGPADPALTSRPGIVGRTGSVGFDNVNVMVYPAP